MNPPADWRARLARLLAAGAEIHLAEPDGTTRTWPLARHHRHHPDDDGGGGCLWLRPLTGPARTSGGAPVFAHHHARRRPLRYTDVHRRGDTLIFRTPAGQTATLRPVTPTQAGRLADWDTFMAVVLPANVEADLDRLADDSW